MLMNFPFEQGIGIKCFMSLRILPTKLACLAKELFGITLDIDRILQYIVIDHGGRILPIPSLSIQAASSEGISEPLGGSFVRAIENSTQRKIEQSQSIAQTPSVILEIHRSAGQQGISSLNLSLE